MLVRKLIFIFLIGIVSHATAQSYKTEIVVAQDGSGNFTSIQEAINSCKAFPDSPITIRIRNGKYLEKVKVHAWNTKLTLLGEDREKTILSFDDHFDKINAGRNSTFTTYTLFVDANDFRAENLTIENTAGPLGQAVALHVEADRCAFVNCSFLGNQDTIYAAGENARQYFDHCYIEGTTDFIFGAATAVFNACEIVSKADSYITAASTPKGSAYGFVFIKCKLSADNNVSKVYLGRPWRSFAKTVFIDCEMGSHILPEGWDNWNNEAAQKTVFYAEYRSVGPGSHPTQRVVWSHQLSRKEAASYSLKKVLNNWVP